MATSQMRVLSKNKEPRKADALREHSIVKMRQQKSEAKAAQPEEAAGVRLVVQLHGKANQLLPAFGKRFGEGVADLGDKDQAGRRVRHAGGKVDAGAHHVHLAPAVFK